MKTKNILSSRTSYRDVSKPGTYDVWDGDSDDEWWCNIEVFERNGLLRIVNPRNDTECAVNGLIGWMFLARKNAAEALPTHPPTCKSQNKG
jgi:hypothetical protein